MKYRVTFYSSNTPIEIAKVVTAEVDSIDDAFTIATAGNWSFTFDRPATEPEPKRTEPFAVRVGPDAEKSKKRDQPLTMAEILARRGTRQPATGGRRPL